jgi:hypothetical protein
MKIVIVLEFGRLGNQLFQIAFLRKHFHSYSFLLLGFDSLDDFIDKNKQNVKILTRKKLQPIKLSLISTVLSLIVKSKLTNTASGDLENLLIKRGLWSNIILVNLSKCFFPWNLTYKNMLFYSIRRGLINDFARNLVESEVAFLHIRRGDYLYWPNKKEPAVLSYCWYERAFKTLLTEKEQIKYCMVFSDDSVYADDLIFNFQRVFPNVIFENNSMKSEIETLLHMLKTNHGVISPSTFSLFPSFYSINHLGEIVCKNSCLFILPKFWVGHRRNEWVDLHPISECFKYVV